MFTLFRSHKGYTPLSPSEYPAHAHALWTRGRVMILLLVAILASGIMNIVLSVKLWRWPTTAMDNYQDLNTQPIINEDALRELPPINPSDNAVVTTLYTDAYATAIVTLGHSLTKANSTASRLLLYLPSQVSDYALCIATASGFTPEPIARIPPPDNGKGVYARFLDQYSKLNLWTLDKAPHSYKGVVYLDADTLVLRNFDELFHLPANFAAVPDVYRTDGFVLGFNAGVLFLRPSSDAFAHMLARIADARYPRTEAEQAFLNHFYGAEVLRLPYAYNANLAIKERQPRLWAALLAREARVVHYTVVKPFLVAEDDGHTVVDVHDMDEHVLRRMGTKGGLFQEETRLWLDMWRETRREYAEAFRACRARHVGEALEHGRE